MVLIRGVWIGTLYKLLGSTFNDGCNKFVVLNDSNEENRTPIVLGEKTMLWHQRLGYIGENELQSLHGKVVVEGMSDFS